MMAKVTIAYAISLFVLGGITLAVLGGDPASRTAYIPFVLGAIFLVLGGLGFVESLRKHVMHAAAALALLSVIMPVVRLIIGLSSKGVTATSYILGTMIILTATYLALSVNSFIQAAKARRAAAKAAA